MIAVTRPMLLAGFLIAVGAAAAGTASRLPQAPACTVFPATSPWNQRVDTLPVALGSARIVASIGVDDNMHADFGSGLWEGGPIGIPITVVRGTQATSRVAFEYADESDKGPYPIPKNVAIEGGRGSDGDRHALIVDRDRCKLYELFALYPAGGGGWRAGSGAIFDLRSNTLRPAGWTSADAAGLPILPGLARYEEVARGRIDHALRFTANDTRRAYVWPARHFASDTTDPALPPMGLRLRLKQSYPIAGFPRQARIVLQALKEYGMILADNGSDWYLSGAPHPKWSNDQLHTLHRVPGSAFEVEPGTRCSVCSWSPARPSRSSTGRSSGAEPPVACAATSGARSSPRRSRVPTANTTTGCARSPVRSVATTRRSAAGCARRTCQSVQLTIPAIAK